MYNVYRVFIQQLFNSFPIIFKQLSDNFPVIFRQLFRKFPFFFMGFQDSVTKREISGFNHALALQ